METRGIRRSGVLEVDQFSPMGKSLSSSSRSGARPKTSGRSCSFALLLQVFLGLLCVSFFLQWWHWRPIPLVNRHALHATQEANDAYVNLRGGEHVEPATQGEDGLTTTPQKRLTLPPTLAPVANGAFRPPTSDTSPEEIRAWRQRFDPSKHNADQQQVAEMVKWAWKGYEDFAFGYDYLDVVRMKGDGLPGHDMAITLVDSLDTLFLLGMFDEFDHASDWVGKNMKDRIYQARHISLFETTIRNMGGLLSAYYLSGHEQLLTAAADLGEALSPAFTVHDHGIPGKDFDVIHKSDHDSSSIAEVGSLQLEFKYLAYLTGNRKYYMQVERIMDKLFSAVNNRFTSGLLPVHLSMNSGDIVPSKVTLGAFGDSYYEYLLKQWLQSGKTDDKYRKQYVTAVQGISERLVAKSKPNGLTFIGELVGGKLEPKMDHLVCFVPGMLALGYIHGMPEAHLDLAKQLIETCYQMYAQMNTKLAPEIAYFNMKDGINEDLDIHNFDAFNLQRPETVESLMILYRVTKDKKYRDYGRAIMNAFEANCKLPKGGYTTVGNVAKGPAKQFFRDGMESFFIAETLKYLFLLFSDDETLLPLDEIVFNTEAHPFPIMPQA
ncbi:hypothetical protein Poli38472_002976 [Pythium oligandrum]|uniref:alpha-1,2-Mannosidase n=1 Tax=Pythium oligandrum TaxID=41045 RepID=A0A8K1C5N9_PYTOL|nr:hypothetical protein Poli38472_002976 [Pythium oligandrum]|eukprot:TMW57051.1 hypothetical protein Poli38472_002976 [Pythium oligandrum]